MRMNGSVKIGTHNSATGERGKSLKDWLLTPFACCQSKTIKEQLESGVRYFDLRVRENKKGEWICCHGIWESNRTIQSILKEISDYGDTSYIMITYEGKDVNREYFLDTVFTWFNSSLILTSVNIKKPYGTCLYKNLKAPKVRHRYLGLGGATWHTYLPIPWLWKKLYFNNPEFVDDRFTLVDFW